MPTELSLSELLLFKNSDTDHILGRDAPDAVVVVDEDVVAVVVVELSSFGALSEWLGHPVSVLGVLTAVTVADGGVEDKGWGLGDPGTLVFRSRSETSTSESESETLPHSRLTPSFSLTSLSENN